MNSADCKPIISICIPTFNRSASLGRLLENLCSVKDEFQNEIEICISDNCSEDDTANQILKYKERLDLKVERQIENIGGTLNIIVVAKMMTGEWGMLLGDDDSIDIKGLGALIGKIKTTEKNTWILAEVKNKETESKYFERFQKVEYSNKNFMNQLFIRGLDSFGFMGTHVFPKQALIYFSLLSISNSRPWPHMAAMLRALTSEGYAVSITAKPVVNQAGGGLHLFWATGDMAIMRLSKLNILKKTIKDANHHRRFLRLIMLRELYSLENLKYLFKWKLQEIDDFKFRAKREYINAYRTLGWMSPFALPHLILLVLLVFMPWRALFFSMNIFGRQKLYDDYRQLKMELGENDGIKRGI